MILKRKEFVIQWRKFEIKRSCILRIMHFWTFYTFLIFIWGSNWFIIWVFPYLNHKKEFTYLQVLTWWAGPAGELMWRAGPPRGCDVALRPRGRAAGGPREAHVAHRARTHGKRPLGPCESTRTPVRGATWQRGCQLEGPRVSGPLL